MAIVIYPYVTAEAATCLSPIRDESGLKIFNAATLNL